MIASAACEAGAWSGVVFGGVRTRLDRGEGPQTGGVRRWTLRDGGRHPSTRRAHIAAHTRAREAGLLVRGAALRVISVIQQRWRCSDSRTSAIGADHAELATSIVHCSGDGFIAPGHEDATDTLRALVLRPGIDSIDADLRKPRERRGFCGARSLADPGILKALLHSAERVLRGRRSVIELVSGASETCVVRADSDTPAQHHNIASALQERQAGHGAVDCDWLPHGRACVLV